MSSSSFTIPGIAIPKGRPRAYVTDSGYARMYTPRRTRDFEDEVGWEARRGRVRMHAGIVSVALRIFGTKRGDIDNFAKAILDGVNGIAFDDDGQVDELYVVCERVAKPARTEVLIRPRDPAVCLACGVTS